MYKNILMPLVAASALLACGAVAGAQTSAPAMSGDAMHGSMMSTGSQTGPDHGMPAGTAGGDGVQYTGAPNLDAAISLVTAGGKPGDFSIATALDALAGPKLAAAEEAKLTKQYGKEAFTSFVTVQDFAVNDAVKIATAAGVKFPTPTLSGAALAKGLVGAGLVDDTFYTGVMLDHAVTAKIHDAAMDDIDKKYGAAADANYHKISDQAFYDLAQALGVTSVKLASYH